VRQCHHRPGTYSLEAIRSLILFAARHKSPIAEEALHRIGQLYALEAEISGQSAEQRALAGQAQARPLLEEKTGSTDDFTIYKTKKQS
jgi:hypothetical protein